MAIGIICEQLMEGVGVGVDASIVAAVDQFNNFVVDNTAELIANNVDMTNLKEVVDKYFLFMLTELAITE